MTKRFFEKKIEKNAILILIVELKIVSLQKTITIRFDTRNKNCKKYDFDFDCWNKNSIFAKNGNKEVENT